MHYIQDSVIDYLYDLDCTEQQKDTANMIIVNDENHAWCDPALDRTLDIFENMIDTIDADPEIHAAQILEQTRTLMYKHLCGRVLKSQLKRVANLFEHAKDRITDFRSTPEIQRSLQHVEGRAKRLKNECAMHGVIL